MAKKWLDKLGNNKTRTLILLLGVIFVVVIISVVIARRKPDPLKTDQSYTTKIPQITAIPGGVTSEKYQELQQADNRRIAEQAKKGGGSAVATIIGNRDSDLLAKKESFGIEGEFIKAGDCKCGEPGALDPALTKKLMADITANPENALKLMQQNPGLAKALCTQNPALALKVIEKNKEAAKIMLKECPDMAKTLAEKNPEMLKQLMLENPDIAKAVSDAHPEVVKALMVADPQFARTLAKANPDIVKKLILNDASFADKMTKANPDMVKDLMKNDLAFARLLTPTSDLISDKSRTQTQTQTRQTPLTEAQQKQIGGLIANMEAQAKTAFDAWASVSTQAFVQGEKKDDKDDASAGAAGSDGNSGASGKGGGDSNEVLIKAGTILFAVLDTAVNTDEPGPVMATIVQGPYQGAKVIGATQLSAQPGNDRPEKVTLNFTTLSTANSPKSLVIQGVAIDTDTARTALASDVDHHYLLRYGTLFASSFMNGYAKVITSQGTVQTNSGTGSSTTTTPTISGRKEVFAALGEVGKKFGEASSSFFTTPNTITVNAGTGIGLLILTDVKKS
jgi:type IV secretory pathway VirB10-like protein